MTPTAWIEWSTKQLADLARKLSRQGYTPKLIQRLCASVPEFDAHYQSFSAELQALTEAMVANPDGYHHYDGMDRIKQEFLVFTNLNRVRFLFQPAKIA